ncbi:type II/IV secretion system ATPase subunit [Candidatus Pacearchaeota archaeon]|nr:type II/IV secretion system ATPase subunit [Candidatus Pacearchaeota archaeon]
MQFEKEAKLYSYEAAREGGEDVLYVNYFGAPHVPSLAENSEDMGRIIDHLIENPNVSRIILSQQKNYNYDLNETLMLLEIAQFYVYLLKQENILSQRKLITNQTQLFAQRYNKIFSFLLLLKKDPVAAYFELRRLIIENKIIIDKIESEAIRSDYVNYLYFLEKIFSLFEKTKLIQSVQKYLKDYQKGSREIYHKIFRPDIIPNFTFTRLVSDLPDDAEIVNQYKISGEDYDESLVTILKMKNESKLMYHLTPPEHSLSEEHNLLLNLARTVLIEHQPKAEEFTDSERIRSVFFNISRDLLRDLANTKGIKLSYSELNKLKHGEYDECLSNIRPSQEDADSWAAKFRMISGRPLDEANPILDTQLEIGKLRARIAIIQRPLSVDGLSYSIRRHRENPWTLPLFVKNKMLNPFAAGLLSFLIDGSRTLLVAGTRSSGKTSLLGSLMLEIIPKFRMIVIEDTLELPVESLRELQYNIVRMKVRSALLKSGTEVSAEDGIRTSLRLGDSSLIVGEIRSTEAEALYEAMRVGALANVVAGTIHGASPYGVFDRVVNDLKVPTTSFKATDIIAVCNPIKSADGLHSWKRMLQLAEVRKHWKQDPLAEKGFVDLLRYNVKKDELEPTDENRQ